MAHSNSGIVPLQELWSWCSNNFTATNNHCITACNCYTTSAELKTKQNKTKMSPIEHKSDANFIITAKETINRNLLINSMQPFGVQGRKPEVRSPTASIPWFSVFSPSTSLLLETESVISVELIGFTESNGIWTIIPWMSGSLLYFLNFIRSCGDESFELSISYRFVWF